MSTGKRFKVALSFPGEKREFIEQVAEYLAKEYGRKHVFYDMYHKVELAQPSMDLILMDNYKVNAELVVAFLCREYDEKEWCGVEWRVIRHIIKEKRYNEIMPFRFDDAEIDGFLSIDGYIFIDANESPESIANYIIERIRLNDDTKPKVTGTISDLQNIEAQLAQLTNIVQNQVTNPGIEKQIQQLTSERDLLKQQLLQTEEIIEQHKKIKEELEQSLSKQKGNEALKQKAFEAVEKEDYDTAEELLKESTKDAITEAAEGFYQLGNIKELKLEYRPALEYYEKAVGINNENSQYSAKAAGMLAELGFHDRAIDYLQNAIATEMQEHPYGIMMYKLYNNIGLEFRTKGEYDKAIEYYSKAENVYNLCDDIRDVSLGVLYNNIGMAMLDKGDNDNAFKYISAAIDIGKKELGENHPEMARRYNNIGNIQLIIQEYDKAIKNFIRALLINDKNYHNHPDMGVCYNNLGEAYRLKGEFDVALEFYHRSLKSDMQYYGESHPGYAATYNNIGLTYNSKEDYVNALYNYDLALDIYVKFYGESHPQIGVCYNNIAGVYWDKKELDEAIVNFAKALSIFSKYYNDQHYYTSNTRNALAACIVERNKKQNL